MAKKVLVTGANGFVGNYLIRELMCQGYLVRTAVRGDRPMDLGIEQVVINSIDGETDWAEALQDIDVVIHLAARAHLLHEGPQESLEEFLKVNLFGTEKLARQAASCGVKRVVYVSTIGVNGASTHAGQPFTESDRPDPHSSYSVSKWQAEMVLHTISKETGLECVILRPPLVYGADAPGNFAKLLKLLAKGVPLPLASVQNQRSLIYVKNLVSALILCATHPAAAGQTYLVSDGEDISTPQLMRLLGNEIGHPARLFLFPPAMLQLIARLTGKASQVQSLTGALQLDSGKIRRELDWHPPYTLQQGMQEAGTYFRKNHS
jgi:nucleoside-diphosphate-sugar epimerase